MNLFQYGLQGKFLSSFQSFVDKSKRISESSYMKKELVDRYYEAYRKLESNEITQQQWYDLCLQILGEIMEENKDVLVRLKDR